MLLEKWKQQKRIFYDNSNARLQQGFLPRQAE